MMLRRGLFFSSFGEIYETGRSFIIYFRNSISFYGPRKSEEGADTALIHNFCWPYKSSLIVSYFSLCFRLSNTSRWVECGITLSSGQEQKSSYRLYQSSMSYTLSHSVRHSIVRSFTIELKINPQSTCRIYISLSRNATQTQCKCH